jgi:hypothetical protein
MFADADETIDVVPIQEDHIVWDALAIYPTGIISR